MPTPSRLLVPFVVALLVGASAPALAEEPASPEVPSLETTAEPTAEPTEEPTAEATTEPTTEPATQPTTEPADEPPAQPSSEPTAPVVKKDRQPAQRAAAAPSTVTTATELTTALSACDAGDTVTLGADMTVSGSATVECDLTIDLAGYALRVSGIDIAAGRHLTIDDSESGGSITTSRSGSFEAGIKSTDARLTIDGGTVTAAGGSSGAGIGGGGDDGRNGGNGGVITINGGTVTATGGNNAAGIGGAGWGDGGTITINGGTVTARGGISGAGIGSGYNRGFTAVRINGGQVTATAGADATAIGTGAGGSASGAPIEVGAAARVSVSARAGTPVLGVTRPGSVNLTIDGVLNVDSGNLDASAAAWTIGSTGSVLGPVATPTAGVNITGSGTIRNDGVLLVASRAATASVTGHHYRITYDLAGGTGTADPVTIFAPTFDAARVSLPTPAARPDRTFTGWTRDGEPFDAESDLGAGSTDGEPAPITLVARWELTTAAQLATALSDCADELVTVDADLTTSSRLAVDCDVTLDLNGHTVTTPGVDIGASKTFTVDDSGTGGQLDARTTNGPGIRVENAEFVVDGGTVNAQGGHMAAGIGSGQSGTTGSIVINGGTVTTEGAGSGTFGGAGIGGGHSSSAPTILITGGTVDASGSQDGAGIGGGGMGASGSVTITGGTVTATATTNAAAGIGSGWAATSGAVIDISGGTVTATGAPNAAGIGSGMSGSSFTSLNIGAGADVTAFAGDGRGLPVSAVGFGSHNAGDSRADVQIDGTLRTPGGTLIVDRLDVSIGGTGRILGSADAPRNHTITGTGTIDNGGVIAGSVMGTVQVNGNHFWVVAPNGEDVTVYGPSIRAGHRDMLAEPTRGIDTFAGWTVDGDPFTATTTLPGASTDGAAVRVDLTATWDEGTATFDPSGSVAVIVNDDPTDVDLTLTDGDGDPVAVDPADWDLDVPAGLALVHDADGWHLSGTTLGTNTISATTTAGGRDYTATLEVTVAYGPVTTMTLSHTGDAEQDGTITVSATGADATGNDLGDVTGDVTLTSSVATDVIDGNTVTFPHASPHTITATHANGTTATLVVEVTPTPAAPVEPAPIDDQPAAEDEPADADRAETDTDTDTDTDTEKSESALADTGSSATVWWLASALALVLVGGALMRRPRRR